MTPSRLRGRLSFSHLLGRQHAPSGDEQFGSAAGTNPYWVGVMNLTVMIVLFLALRKTTTATSSPFGSGCEPCATSGNGVYPVSTAENDAVENITYLVFFFEEISDGTNAKYPSFVLLTFFHFDA